LENNPFRRTACLWLDLYPVFLCHVAPCLLSAGVGGSRSLVRGTGWVVLAVAYPRGDRLPTQSPPNSPPATPGAFLALEKHERSEVFYRRVLID